MGSVECLLKVFDEIERRIEGSDVVYVKASTLKDFYAWCPIRCYATFVFENGSPEDEMRCGISFDEVVKPKRAEKARILGIIAHGMVIYGFFPVPKSIPTVEEALRNAKEGHPIPRNIEVAGKVVQVQGAIDIGGVREAPGGLIIGEDKTVERGKCIDYYVDEGLLQASIYGWILSPYTKISRVEVVIKDRYTGEVIYRESKPFNMLEAEGKVREIIENLLARRLWRTDKRWRCNNCTYYMRRLCKLSLIHI